MKSLNESLRNSLLLEARPDEATIERVADLAEEIKANKDLIKAGYIVTNSGTRKGRQKPASYGRDGWLLDLDLEKEDGSNITYNDIDNIAKILGLNDIKTKTLSFNRKSVSGYIENDIICDIWSADDVINLAVIKLRIPKK